MDKLHKIALLSVTLMFLFVTVITILDSIFFHFITAALAGFTVGNISWWLAAKAYKERD